MCAIRKEMVMIDGEGSMACPDFQEAKFCSNCEYFVNPDKYGIGTCLGYEKENWAYASCGAFGCEKYRKKQQENAGK